jgi:hypothetical protein
MEGVDRQRDRVALVVQGGRPQPTAAAQALRAPAEDDVDGVVGLPDVLDGADAAEHGAVAVVDGDLGGVVVVGLAVSAAALEVG